MVQLVLILANLRSSYNVGAILRTADAVGLERVLCVGSTPYPRVENDGRDPVVVKRNTREIAKTALGAETSVNIEHFAELTVAMAACRTEGRTIYALEQSAGSTNLFAADIVYPAALLVGNEVSGLPSGVLQACDAVLEIPQSGAKESLNVSVAAGIGLYQFWHQSNS
jgi:23S rRNA (guanosine2251-2'-O)-methyltransferase